MEIRSIDGQLLKTVDSDSLRSADLSGANLRGANLNGADLRRADLNGADLRGADLCGADLRRADLCWADLGGADLSGADLSGADLGGANLRLANLSRADLRRADLSGADLCGAVGLPNAPVIPQIDAAILTAITAGGSLEMSSWHTCATTHCRAGWAITLAGERGKKLEQQYGPNVAGALIYHASNPDRPVPDWLASNEDALADMKERAGVK